MKKFEINATFLTLFKCYQRKLFLSLTKTIKFIIHELIMIKNLGFFVSLKDANILAITTKMDKKRDFFLYTQAATATK